GDWPWIVSMPAFAPVPKAKDNPQTYGQHPVTSGPYQVESYQQGVAVTLSPNRYWDAGTDQVRTAAPDKIVLQLGQDDTVAAQRLIADSGRDRDAFGADFVRASPAGWSTTSTRPPRPAMWPRPGICSP